MGCWNNGILFGGCIWGYLGPQWCHWGQEHFKIDFDQRVHISLNHIKVTSKIIHKFIRPSSQLEPEVSQDGNILPAF